MVTFPEDGRMSISLYDRCLVPGSGRRGAVDSPATMILVETERSKADVIRPCSGTDHDQISPKRSALREAVPVQSAQHFWFA